MATKEITGLTALEIALDDDLVIIRDDSTGADKKIKLIDLKRMILGIQDGFTSNYDGNIERADSAIMASLRSYMGAPTSAIIGSVRTKISGTQRVGGGYGATDLAVPTEGIVTPAAPVDGRTMVSGGTYTGSPWGSADPVFEIIIMSSTTFRWKKTINGVIVTPYGAPDTITGAAQTLENGVTVTFSTTTGWTAGEWSITIDDTAFTANRKWEFNSQTGDLLLAGAVTPSYGFTDYGEFFENFLEEVIPFGTIVTESGGKIAPAIEPGEFILGVISATAGIRLGDTPFTWKDRFLRGDFGETLLDENGDQIENPDYEPGIENTPRSERPEEWSLVGLLGQVYTRVKAGISPGDFIESDGSKSTSETCLRCMKITKPYSESDGYAIAYCLIR